jgi:hypothetical protein
MDISTILSINQAIHNIGAVLFVAGPFYILLILFSRKRIKDDYIYPIDRQIENTFAILPPLWLFLLILQGVTGGSFGLISLIYEGELPQIAPVAMIALTIKILGVIVAFFISFYLWWFLVPKLKDFIIKYNPENKPSQDSLVAFLALRKKRDRFVWFLLLLAIIILTGAAFLRWNI